MGWRINSMLPQPMTNELQFLRWTRHYETRYEHYNYYLAIHDYLFYNGHRSSTARTLKIMNGKIVIIMLITGLVVPGPPQKLQLIGHGLGQHRIDAPEGHPGFNKLFIGTGMLKTIRFQINQVLRGSRPVPAL